MRKYFAFIKVIECGSFTVAADELSYTQSAISQMVSALEKELNTTLFIRSKYGLQLTKEGETLYPYIKELVDAHNSLYEKAKSLNALQMGTIKVATFGSFANVILPNIYKDFHKAYPNIVLETRQGAYKDIEHWLNKDMADFGITKIDNIKGFEKEPLFEDPMYAIIPVEHRLKEEENIEVKNLAGEKFISLDEENDADYLDMLNIINHDFDIQCKVCDYITIQAMVENGLGVSILPKLASFSGKYNVLKKNIIPPVSRSIGIVYKNKNTLSPSSQIFIRYILEHIKEYEQGI